MVRTDKHTGAVTLIAIIALPLLLAGCATPRTQLEWGTRRAPEPVKTAAVVKPTPRPHYSSDDDDRYVSNTPVPRSRPARYQPQERQVDRPVYGDASFIWPVKGRVLSEFGARQSGERNDGINIAAAEGTPIYAAADGSVSYSGNELRNYGNLMLVRHSNGYVTAYAHADHFIVAKGDHVSKGEVIGYVGQTGDVSRPQLHFELRKGTRGEVPVNPRAYLGPLQVAQR